MLTNLAKTVNTGKVIMALNSKIHRRALLQSAFVFGATLIGTATQTQSARASRREDMVRIAAGTYIVGSDDGPLDSRPAHRITVKAFFIDRYEVTNQQFATFLNTLGVRPRADAAPGRVSARAFQPEHARRFIEGDEGDEDAALIVALDDSHCRIGIQNRAFTAQRDYEHHPVTETTWRGARLYAAWREARLPTEAEWEIAARGATNRRYPWGAQPPSDARAVIGRTSGQTERVGSRSLGATPEGVHDLAGNVAEWTSTLYRPYPYNATDGRENLSVSGERVTRGGDHVYDSAPNELTVYHRTGFSRAPGRGHRHIGFRCARSS
jgi:formylglycine-generating enzyme required for sulfatase activity